MGDIIQDITPQLNRTQHRRMVFCQNSELSWKRETGWSALGRQPQQRSHLEVEGFTQDIIQVITPQLDQNQRRCQISRRLSAPGKQLQQTRHLQEKVQAITQDIS